MHWEEFCRHIFFTDVFSTDLQIEHRIFLYGDIVYWSVISIFIYKKKIFQRTQCFLASDWLKYETLPRKFRTL